jgi:hypothetical protein
MSAEEGMDAQRACQTISTKAEEIAAKGNAIANAISKVFTLGPLIDPKSYQASNDAKQMVKNITKLDMHDEDVYKLVSSCNNIVTQNQTNEIDMTVCSTPEYVTAWGALLNGPFCVKNPDKCTLHDISQSNVANTHSSCVLNGLMDIAKSQKATIDTAAVVEAAQKATNLASNTSSSGTCNYVNNDMSSQRYIEVMNSCAANLNTTQTNKITGCLPMYNISQKNDSSAMNECMITNQAIIKTDNSSDTKTTSKTILEQIAEGINPMAASVASLVCCIIAALIAAYFFLS